MVKEIPLTQDKTAIVDDEDYNLVIQHKWCYNNGYAVNSRLGSMHEYIFINLPESWFTDEEVQDVPVEQLRIMHLDGNGTNNTRKNLKLVTAACVARRRRKRKNSRSKYKGVSYVERDRAWIAYIRVNGKASHLKQSTDEIECAKAYDRAALKYYGKCAILNFPELKDTEYRETP